MAHSYIVVASGNNEHNIFTIPKIWVINNDSEKIIVGNNCEWYYPTENGRQNAEFHVAVNKNWNKQLGKVLCLAGKLYFGYVYNISIHIFSLGSYLEARSLGRT